MVALDQRNSKKAMVWQLSKRKKAIAFFGRTFFAKLQSVAISQWSLRFFALIILFPKKQ